MTATIVVGVVATKAPWSVALRSYIRDHTQGMLVEVIMDRAGLARSGPRLDVLVVDDLMRTLSPSEISGAQHLGAYVIGLYDECSGMGREHVLSLGADHVLPASTAPAELVGLIPENRRRSAATTSAALRTSASGGEHGRRSNGGQGLVSAWTKVSGGSGLTEVVVAAAEHLAKRDHVLVIEADEVAPVLASRLLRSTDNGLAWAVSRAGQGHRVLPEGLSGPREDGTAPVGHFDVICGTPGAAQVIPAAELLRLLEEAATAYDHVLVETSWLVGLPSGRERFGASRAVLAAADRAVVLASADPEGAARLVEWRAAALAAGFRGPGWAAFGRTRPSRYERSHLANVLQVNTGRHPFEAVWFLPEDATLARARWNAEIVWKGPWLRNVNRLADAVAAKDNGGRSTQAAPRRLFTRAFPADSAAEMVPL
ncbi:MAG TPA: hypothetical protein VMF65_17115 [Acidimicrobiales bacterium]|nr:hypothetical protein [Acidimicrobiales bacterium]